MKQANIFLALVAGLLVAGGCSMQCPVQKVQSSDPEGEARAPIMVDQAMQLREWQRTPAYYGNGNVVAGPAGFMYQPRWGQPDWVYSVEETPLFVGQVVTIPIPLIINPPWTPVMYNGVTVPPSYTALPPLPGQASMEPMAAPTTQP